MAGRKIKPVRTPNPQDREERAERAVHHYRSEWFRQHFGNKNGELPPEEVLVEAMNRAQAMRQ